MFPHISQPSGIQLIHLSINHACAIIFNGACKSFEIERDRRSDTKHVADILEASIKVIDVGGLRITCLVICDQVMTGTQRRYASGEQDELPLLAITCRGESCDRP